MPQWAGSCWYYLRYLDPDNDQALIDPEIERYWMVPADAAFDGDGGVGLYVGGVEHAVLHLLYARFWHKVLYDLGHVSTPEPFRRLVNQGYILADAFTDERGMYVEAAEVEHEADGYTFNGAAGDPPDRQDGQEPEEQRQPRRHLHAGTARTRCGCTRWPPGRWRPTAVADRGHHRRAPVPAAAVAQHHRRDDGGAAGQRRDRSDDGHAPAAAPDDHGGPRGSGDAALQHRDRPADRADHARRPGRCRARGAPAGAGRAAGADGGAAGPAHRRGAVGAGSAIPSRSPTPRSRWPTRRWPPSRPSSCRCRSTGRCGSPSRCRRRRRGRDPAGADWARGLRPGHRGAAIQRIVVVPGRIANVVTRDR